MKEALGLDPIFTPLKSRSSGIKFVVTITTISDTTLYLMSNYNSKGSHSKELTVFTLFLIVTGLMKHGI
jgi:hypothetical protein